MPKASPGIVSFNAGELSPRLDGRTDLDKYGKGCRTLENFIPLVQGGAEKRSGTRYVREATTATRLIPFSFNASDSYVISLASTGIRFHRNNAPVFDSTKNITAATQANPVVITSVAHGFSNGDTLVIAGVLGMVEVNNMSYTVANKTADTFELSGVNGTGFAAYVSGGTASRLYTISCPYSADEIETLQWAGQNDVLYFACPTKPPYKLSRFGHASWTMAAVAFFHLPFSPENTDESNYVAYSALGPYLYSPSGNFTSSMVGSYIKFREVIESNNPEWQAKTDFDGDEYIAFQDNNASWQAGDRCHFEGKVYECTRRPFNGVTGTAPPTHEIGIVSDGSGDWKFINYGYGYAKITAYSSAYRVTVSQPLGDSMPIPRSCTSNYVEVVSMTTANPIVVTVSGAHGWDTSDTIFFYGITGTFGTLLNNTTRTIVRLGTATFSINGTNGAGLTGGASGGLGDGAVRIVASTQPNHTVGKIYPSLSRWSYNAWDAVRGYPRTVLFFEDRLIWGSTASNPQTCWASRTGRYEDHATFEEDDSALVFTLSTADPMEWLKELNALVAGSSGDEFSSNRDSAEPLSAGNVNTIRRRSQYGSRRNVNPVVIENAVIFAQRSGRKLRELVFDEAQGGLVASDLTRLADHVSLGLIKQMAFQGEPNRILWVVMADGTLYAFTYEREEQVFGWHKHVLGGVSPKVKSVAVIPHPDGDGDQLWLLVERTIGGGAVRFIEYMEKQWLRTAAIADAYFVDGGQTYSGSAATVLSGLRVLAGETVAVLADGLYVGTQAVTAAGKVTLATAATKAQVGLPYTSTLIPSRLEAGSGDGTAQGKTKRIHSVVLRLDQAGAGLYVGPSAARATQEVRLTAGALTDGDTTLVPFPAGYGFDGIIAVKHTTPLPCTVTAIYPQLNTSDR